MRATQALGRHGEDEAVRHVQARGWEVLDRNWRVHGVGERGEIDLVAFDPVSRAVVVIEVKTRRTHVAGAPVEALTAAKRRRLRRLAALWCAQHHPAARELRIDLIALTLPRGGQPVLEHLEGVC